MFYVYSYLLIANPYPKFLLDIWLWFRWFSETLTKALNILLLSNVYSTVHFKLDRYFWYYRTEYEHCGSFCPTVKYMCIHHVRFQLKQNIVHSMNNSNIDEQSLLAYMYCIVAYLLFMCWNIWHRLLVYIN